MQKKLAIWLACIMILILFTCCSKTSNSSSEEGGNFEEIELILTSPIVENDSCFKAYNKAIADFEAANPGVRIKHEIVTDNYKHAIKQAVSENYGDIYYMWRGAFSQQFVESGKILPLDDYFTDEYKSRISHASLTYDKYNNKLYGVTYSATVSSLFYNKRIFEDNGVKPPNTFDELINACEKLIKNGVTPFSISTKDKWLLSMTHDNLVLKSAGHDKVISVLTSNGQSYNSPQFIEGATKFQQLVKMGAFNVKAPELSNDEAVKEFCEGKTAMFVSGSWVEYYLSDIKNSTDFDIIPYPVIGKSASSTDIMGGATDTLMVSKSTKHPSNWQKVFPSTTILMVMDFPHGK